MAVSKPTSPVFSNFAVWFAPGGAVPGAKYLRGLIQRHDGAEAGESTLRWAAGADAACPIDGAVFGSRGRLEVVVVHAQGAQEQAAEAIRKLLQFPSLVCPRCARCHLVSASADARCVPFVAESILRGCAQVQHLRDLCSLPPANRAQSPGETQAQRQSPQGLAVAATRSPDWQRRVRDADGDDRGGARGRRHSRSPAPEVAGGQGAGAGGAAGAEESNNERIASYLRMLAAHRQHAAVASRTAQFSVRTYSKAALAVSQLPEIACLSGATAAEGRVHFVSGHVVKVTEKPACGFLAGDKVWRAAVEALEACSWRREALTRGHRGLARADAIEKELSLVFMIGERTARRLVREWQVGGWRDLRDRLEQRPRAQVEAMIDAKEVARVRLSLELFEDIHHQVDGVWQPRRIPRAETEAVVALVQAVCDELALRPAATARGQDHHGETRGQDHHSAGGERAAAFAKCPHIKVHGCGSYRRGRADSSDIDLVLEPLDAEEWVRGLEVLVDCLEARGHVRQLVGPGDGGTWGRLNQIKQGHERIECQQFFGFVRCGGEDRWRRLDVWLYKRRHVQYGLLQCTGSGYAKCRSSS